MAWTAEHVFGPAFASMNERVVQSLTTSNIQKTLVVQSSSACGVASPSPHYLSNQGTVDSESIIAKLPIFTLLENDYTLTQDISDKTIKCAGNAQSIPGPPFGWLHHTSFLWDFDKENMKLLHLPENRPEYREGRDHNDFLGKVSGVIGSSFMLDLRPSCLPSLQTS